jgi:hypothetical protein
MPDRCVHDATPDQHAAGARDDVDVQVGVGEEARAPFDKQSQVAQIDDDELVPGAGPDAPQ